MKWVLLGLTIISLFIITSFQSHYPQWIRYKILDTGDTINKLSIDSMKEGKWFEEYDGKSEYYYEIGDYLHNRRIGEWNKYNKSDEKIETISYRLGLKHGPSRLFTNGRMVASGNFRGYFHLNNKDTISVVDPEIDSILQVEIDYEPFGQRDGYWYFINEVNGDTTTIILYSLDEIIQTHNVKKPLSKSDSIRIQNMPHNKGYTPQMNRKPKKVYFPR